MSVSTILYWSICLGVALREVVIYITNKSSFQWQNVIVEFIICILFGIVLFITSYTRKRNINKLAVTPEIKRIVDAMHTSPSAEDKIPIARKFARDVSRISRSADKIILSEPCIVNQVNTDSVSVEIKGSVITFPRVLFDFEDGELYNGQHLFYNCRERSDTTRYMIFESR